MPITPINPVPLSLKARTYLGLQLLAPCCIAVKSVAIVLGNCAKFAIDLGCVIHACSYLASGLAFLYDTLSSDIVLKPLLMNALVVLKWGLVLAPNYH